MSDYSKNLGIPAARSVAVVELVEGSNFKRLNFPDPFGYGPEYQPVFPPRHHTLKAIMDNIPETVERIYIFGSSIRIDSATDSDLDVFIIGSLTNDEINKIYRSIPEGEKADILVETEEEFFNHLADGWTGLYRFVYEGGYKIYERKQSE